MATAVSAEEAKWQRIAAALEQICSRGRSFAQ